MTKRPTTISVGILSMPGEHADTIELVDSIAAIDDPAVVTYVHVNGGSADPLCEVFDGLDRVVVTGSDTNLGVAGGRNLQLGADGFLDSDLVLFFDNDLVVSRDVFELYRDAFATLERDHAVGIVGLPYYGYDHVVSRVPDALGPVGGPLASGSAFANRASILDAIVAEAAALGSAVRPSNAGAVPDWRYSYIGSEVHFDRIADRLGLAGASVAPRYNQERPDFHALLANQTYLPASNIPGGSTCMRSDTIRDVGVFDPLFSPYGAEDIEHAARILGSGRTNWIVLQGCLPHGKHTRHGRRHSPGGQLLEFANTARVLRLLNERIGTPDPARATLEFRLGAALASDQHGPANLERALFAALLGIQVAETQLRTNAGPEWAVDVPPLDLEALSPERFGADPTGAALRPLGALYVFGLGVNAVPAERAGLPAEQFVTLAVDELREICEGLLANRADVIGWLAPRLMARGGSGGGITQAQRRQLRLLDRKSAKAAIGAADFVGRLVRKNDKAARALRAVLR